MFAVVRGEGSSVYRFIFADTGGFDRGDLADFEQSLRSFRTLSPIEVADLKPMRLRVVPVGPATPSTASRAGCRCPERRPARACSCCSTAWTAAASCGPGDQVKIVTMGTGVTA